MSRYGVYRLEELNASMAQKVKAILHVDERSGPGYLDSFSASISERSSGGHAAVSAIGGVAVKG